MLRYEDVRYVGLKSSVSAIGKYPEERRGDRGPVFFDTQAYFRGLNDDFSEYMHGLQIDARVPTYRSLLTPAISESKSNPIGGNHAFHATRHCRGDRCHRDGCRVDRAADHPLRR